MEATHPAGSAQARCARCGWGRTQAAPRRRCPPLRRAESPPATRPEHSPQACLCIAPIHDTAHTRRRVAMAGQKRVATSAARTPKVAQPMQQLTHQPAHCGDRAARHPAVQPLAAAAAVPDRDAAMAVAAAGLAQPLRQRLVRPALPQPLPQRHHAPAEPCQPARQAAHVNPCWRRHAAANRRHNTTERNRQGRAPGVVGLYTFRPARAVVLCDRHSSCARPAN